MVPVGSGDDGCSAASKLVYVVDENNKLSQFDPTTKTFHDLGTLNCPRRQRLPAVLDGRRSQRDRVRAVRRSEQRRYSTGHEAVQGRHDAAGLHVHRDVVHRSVDLTEFGMGFSTTTAGGDIDQLFIAGGYGCRDRVVVRTQHARRHHDDHADADLARSMARPSSPETRTPSYGASSPTHRTRRSRRSTRRLVRRRNVPADRRGIVPRSAARVGVRILRWRLLDLLGEGSASDPPV